MNISTLFMATIAFVAPFIPVEIEVLAYIAYEHFNQRHEDQINKDEMQTLSNLMN